MPRPMLATGKSEYLGLLPKYLDMGHHEPPTFSKSKTKTPGFLFPLVFPGCFFPPGPPQKTKQTSPNIWAFASGFFLWFPWLLFFRWALDPPKNCPKSRGMPLPPLCLAPFSAPPCRCHGRASRRCTWGIAPVHPKAFDACDGKRWTPPKKADKSPWRVLVVWTMFLLTGPNPCPERQVPGEKDRNFTRGFRGSM